MTEASTLARTPLHDRHLGAGARIVPFAGWAMPLQYAGIRAEHLAVREAVGIFDVSHMGRVESGGPDAAALLQRVLSNDVAALAVGGSQYSVICREDAGVLDDTLTYRLAPDRFLTVTNAANHAADLAWLRAHAADLDVEVSDRQAELAMVAVQGPRARGLLEQLADGPLPPRHAIAQLTIAALPAIVCTTGYTGEDGAELLVEPDAAGPLWDAIVAAGAQPAGLGARDTLRLEACLPLYGHELTTATDPISAGLGWCCREQSGFIGAEAVARVRAQGPARRLVAFVLPEGGIPREGNAIAGGGVVTSGTMSPCLGLGIGMGYVAAEEAQPGVRLEIDVRGKVRVAEIRKRPLYTSKEH